MSRWSELDVAQAVADGRIHISRPQSPPDGSIPQAATNHPPVGVPPVEPQIRQHAPRKDYKAELVQQCELLGLKMEPEFQFLPNRKFRADWRVHYGIWEGKRPKKITHFIKSPVLVEYEGGLYSSGKRGHSSITGIQRDIEKSNLAQIAGWTVIRVTPKHVVSGEAVKWIMDALSREVICGACHLRQPVPPTCQPNREF